MSRAEWLDLWPAFWRLLRVRIALLRHSVQHCEQRFDGCPPDQTTADDVEHNEADLARWQRRSLAFKRVSRLIPGAHCLARALALRWWMRHHQRPAALAIGVRKDEQGKLHAHAWVELNGHAVDESRDIVAKHQRLSPWQDDKRPTP